MTGQVSRIPFACNEINLGLWDNKPVQPFKPLSSLCGIIKLLKILAVLKTNKSYFLAWFHLKVYNFFYALCCCVTFVLLVASFCLDKPFGGLLLNVLIL